MRQRFEARQHGNAWYVHDNEAKDYNMPKMAVSLYISTEGLASSIAELLNAEWKEFLRNPS